MSARYSGTLEATQDHQRHPVDEANTRPLVESSHHGIALTEEDAVQIVVGDNVFGSISDGL